MKDAPRLYRGLKAVLPRVLAPYLSLSVEGLENVPDRPVIFACNHLSFVDSLVMPMHLRRPVYFLGKADYFESWRTRWFFGSVGVVPVRREGRGAGEDSLRTGVRILERGDCVGIYPEGTRSPDGRLYRGKTGPVRMALAAGVDVIPVAVAGTDVAWPSDARLPSRHPCRVSYGEPLDLSRYEDQRDDPYALRAATDELMFEIMSMSGQEYVDEYAANVKSGTVDVGPPVLEPDTETGEPGKVPDLTTEPDDDDSDRAVG